MEDFAPKTLPAEVAAALAAPFPSNAHRQIQGKAGGTLTTLSSGFVISRLNEVLGVGGWTLRHEVVEATEQAIVVRGYIEIPAYQVASPATYGGSTAKSNSSREDLYKGAATNLLSKAASYLGVGLYLWRDERPDLRVENRLQPASQPASQPTGKPVNKELLARLADVAKCESIDDLQNLWADSEEFQDNQQFAQAMSRRKARIKARAA